MKKIFSILSILLLVTAFSSCNDTDDLTSIFIKSDKKLTTLWQTPHNKPKEIDLWNKDEDAYNKSQELKKIDENFSLSFDGTEDNEKISGTLKGKAVKMQITGTWSADGKSNRMSIKLDHGIDYNKESDILAKEFIKALTSVYKYSGDKNTISLYFKDPRYNNPHIGFVKK